MLNEIKICSGYKYILRPNDPGADLSGYVSYATYKVEQVLGKYLPAKVVIHHINHKKRDNRNENFVACEDVCYHNLLHARENALEACGDVHWRPCCYCGEYDDLKNLYNHSINSTYWHQECQNKRRRVTI